MKIEIELSARDANRLQQICKMIGNSYKHYQGSPLGRATIHDLTKYDVMTLTDLSCAISDAIITSTSPLLNK